MELGEALTVDDEVGLRFDDLLEVGFAVAAKVEDRIILSVLEVLAHQGDGAALEFDAPVAECLERAVVGGDDGFRRGGDGLLAVVVLDLDRGAGVIGLRRVGFCRAAAGQCESDNACQGAQLKASRNHEGPTFRNERIRRACAHTESKLSLCSEN